MVRGASRNVQEDGDKNGDKMISYKERIRRFVNHPIILERGKLFRNWWNHRSIYGIASVLTCPECGASAENLVWKCHDLTIPEASELAHMKHQRAMIDKKDIKTLEKFKEEIGWNSQSSPGTRKSEEA